MKTLLTRAIIFVSLVSCGFSLPKDPEAYRIWEQETLGEINSLQQAPHDEAIVGLGRLVFQLALPGQREPGDRPVYRAAQEALIAIPNHAEWYGKRIKELTEQDITGLGDSRERAWDFQTLAQLQSPGSVKVLGEFLFDERDPWKDGDWGGGGRPYANSFHAVEALHQLGIHNAPVTRKYADVYGDVRTWQLWFEQVRAGKRTFSFEGSDTIYSLEGPLTATPQATGKPVAASSSQDKESNSGSRSGPWLLLVGGFCAVFIGSAIFWSKRRQAVGR